MIRAKKVIIVLALVLLLFIPLALLFSGCIEKDVSIDKEGHQSPKLSSVSPPRDTTNVSVAIKISATFNDTINQTSMEKAFSISPPAKGSFYWYGDTLTFVPCRNLAYNTTYTTNIDGASWQFETAKKGFPVTIIDDLGYSITITEKPERILSLAPSNTEILFALGLGDKVVGVTEYCNYPEEAKEKNKIGDYSTPNIERVINLEPDLVLTAYGNPMETVVALKGFDLTVVGLKSGNLDEILYDIRVIGEITGQSDSTSVLVADMAQRIEATEGRINKLNLEKKPTVLHVIWHDPIWVAGKGTFEDELIRKSGGVNIASVGLYKTISLEKVIEMNPDVIITPSGTGMGFAKTNFTYEYITNEPRLKSVDAVRNNRVYIIDADIVCRAGPRIVDALEEIAKDLQP